MWISGVTKQIHNYDTDCVEVTVCSATLRGRDSPGSTSSLLVCCCCDVESLCPLLHLLCKENRFVQYRIKQKLKSCNFRIIGKLKTLARIRIVLNTFYSRKHFVRVWSFLEILSTWWPKQQESNHTSSPDSAAVILTTFFSGVLKEGKREISATTLREAQAFFWTHMACPLVSRHLKCNIDGDWRREHLGYVQTAGKPDLFLKSYLLRQLSTLLFASDQIGFVCPYIANLFACTEASTKVPSENVFWHLFTVCSPCCYVDTPQSNEPISLRYLMFS